MPIDIMFIFQVYLPELIGGLFVANALYFFGQNDKFEKNNLIVAAIAFLVLSIKDIINIVFLTGYVEPVTYPTYSANWIAGTTVALTALSSMLMIVGAFNYSKLLSWVKAPVVTVIILIFWALISYIAFLPFPWSQFLPSVYLSIGLAFLGLFFCFVPSTVNMANLRLVGALLIGLALYYLQSAVHLDSASWVLESLLYTFITIGIFRSAVCQLRKETKGLAKELKNTKAKIPMIIQASPFPIIISALKDDRLLLVNEKASALFNIDMKNIKKFRTEEYFVDPNARRELLQKLSVSPTVENFQAVLRKPGTEESFWLEISARVMDYENEVALYSAFKDITAQKKHEQDLFEKAVLDPLTGCYNRRQFQELAMKEIRRAWRYDTQFSLLMMDIDHFKRVNDTHGHAFGDEVLKAMARTCKQTLRESDIFARFGGEEFIVLLPQTDLNGGALVGERLRQNIANCPVPLPSGEMFHFSVSIGVVGSGASDDLDELIKRADSALYAAKENGRNQVKVYGEKESFEALKKETLNEEEGSESISEKIIEQANARNEQSNEES